MHSLEFDRIYANMGTVTRISYDNAFSNPKSEKMIRQMVKSAFEGKIVKIPGTSISMSALVNQERFRLRFNTDSMKIGNKKFPEEGSILMYIHGTIIGGDTRPMQMIQGLLHNYDSMFFVPKDIEKISVPNNAYSIELITPLMTAPFSNFDDMLWFVTGKSGEFTDAATYVALEILQTRRESSKRS